MQIASFANSSDRRDRGANSPSVVFFAPSAYVLSGLATWLDYLVPELRSRGWRAQLCLVSGLEHHRPSRYLQFHPEQSALIAHCDTNTPVGRVRALTKVLEAARPDVALSVNIPDLFPAINRLRQKGQSSARVIMSVHGIERFLYADMSRYAAVIDEVACTNRLACALAASLGNVEADRVSYAACGVDEVMQSSSPSVPSDGCLRIVYSGRLEAQQKRCFDLLGILAELRNLGVSYRLDIVGDGPERSRLETFLSEDIARKSVIMHGFVSRSDLGAHIYSRADIMIIPSLWETGPIVAWEAMAHGVCVVSSRYVGSGLESAIRDEETALTFEVGDTRGAAAALERVWRDPDLRSQLRRSGVELVRSRYSVKASTDAWESVLMRTLQRQPQTAAHLPVQRRAGRLDSLLGVDMAESARQLLGLRGRLASNPGGEWSHSHSGAVSDQEFWDLAARLDGDTTGRGLRSVAAAIGAHREVYQGTRS